jgi:hypothetical protein
VVEGDGGVGLVGSSVSRGEVCGVVTIVVGVVLLFGNTHFTPIDLHLSAFFTFMENWMIIF